MLNKPDYGVIKARTGDDQVFEFRKGHMVRIGNEYAIVRGIAEDDEVKKDEIGYFLWIHWAYTRKDFKKTTVRGIELLPKNNPKLLVLSDHFAVVRAETVSEIYVDYGPEDLSRTHFCLFFVDMPGIFQIAKGESYWLGNIIINDKSRALLESKTPKKKSQKRKLAQITEDEGAGDGDRTTSDNYPRAGVEEEAGVQEEAVVEKERIVEKEPVVVEEEIVEEASVQEEAVVEKEAVVEEEIVEEASVQKGPIDEGEPVGEEASVQKGPVDEGEPMAEDTITSQLREQVRTARKSTRSRQKGSKHTATKRSSSDGQKIKKKSTKRI